MGQRGTKMRIGVLGTGTVGQAIARKLVFLGHDVIMGARERGNEKALGFAEDTGAGAGSFGDAATGAELIVNATAGAHSIAALQAAGAENLRGKILLDCANPLEFSNGMPGLFVANTDSLGEQIQRAFPEAQVVKSLCTVNASVMVDPGRLPGAHAIYVSGNDPAAKLEVTRLLDSFGWRVIIDTGDIVGARGQEMMIIQWIRVARALGSFEFNYSISKAE